jgi:hypothetical protein
VRCRHHPHVGGLDRLGAEPLELAVFDRAQDLGLTRRAHVGDLVDEERSAVGQLELAAHAVLRTGEGAAFVAEELTVEKRVR